MLGIAHEGVAFPLLWEVLSKRGSSNTGERTELVAQFLEVFPCDSIAYLTADREFLGKEWFGYLLGSKVPFRIRVRYSDKLSDGRTSLPARVLFAELQPGHMKVLAKRRRLWGRWLHVAALHSAEGQLVVVVTPDSPQTAIADYARRWEIETLFDCLKERGFDLESIHLKEPERLSKLIALLSLALCWACRTGHWQHQLKPIKLKKHGCKAKSLFRYGLDFLRNTVLHLEQKLPQFQQALRFLSCT